MNAQIFNYCKRSFLAMTDTISSLKRWRKRSKFLSYLLHFLCLFKCPKPKERIILPVPSNTHVYMNMVSRPKTLLETDIRNAGREGRYLPPDGGAPKLFKLTTREGHISYFYRFRLFESVSIIWKYSHWPVDTRPNIIFVDTLPRGGMFWEIPLTMR